MSNVDDRFEAKAHRVQEILEGVFDPKIARAMAIHDAEQQLEVAWVGKRTPMSSDIGLAVTERMDGPAIRAVNAGFEAKTGAKWRMMRDAFELGDERGRAVKHVVARLDYDSRYVLTILFQDGQSAGAMSAIERRTLDALLSAIVEDASSAGIRIR